MCLALTRKLPLNDTDYIFRMSLAYRSKEKGGAARETLTAELQLPDPAAPQGWRRRQVSATAFGWWALLPHCSNDARVLSTLRAKVDPKVELPAFEGLPPLHVLVQYGRRPWDGVATVATDRRLSALLFTDEGVLISRLLEQVAGGITPLYRCVLVWSSPGLAWSGRIRSHKHPPVAVCMCMCAGRCAWATSRQ